MKAIFLVASLFFSTLVYSQDDGSVSGTITDMEMNGEPLLFASVKLKNTKWRTETNLHGNFELRGIAPGNYILAVAFPGYETLEVPVNVKKDKALRIQREIFAKSIDVSAVIQSKDDTTTKITALTSSRSE